MKFEEAFDRAFEKQDQREKSKGFGGFKCSSATAKTLAFLWNMLAEAQNVLDDFAFISDDNGEFTIVSIPINKEPKTPKGKKDKDSKGDKPSTVADATLNEGTDDGKKEQEGSTDN